ncbi:MAG: hypothetical protein LBN11_07540 [Tannerella sp.]|jgi:hypothetical protein|nr:hypothetical protein [Tannerella sp.]
MKRIFLNLMALTCILGMASTCEDDDESLANKGHEAGVEFCNCYKNNSKDYCLNKLTSNYPKSTYTSSAFVKEFNSTNSCNAELTVTYTKAASDSKENILMFKQ